MSVSNQKGSDATVLRTSASGSTSTRSVQGKQSLSGCPVLPMEVVNIIMLFRETHPVAKLIQDLKKKCNLCVVCMKNPRYNDEECCSSTCHHQMTHNPYFDYPTFNGQKFDRYVNEKYENGRWMYIEEYHDDEYWSNW